MDSNFDEGSFKKARSFLMVFSSLLLILWYFKAEMTTLSILGNTVKFTANTQHLWLMLCLVAAYFFFRYVQHLPADWNKSSATRIKIYETVLLRLSGVLYRRSHLQAARARFEQDCPAMEVTKLRVKATGSMNTVDYDPATAIATFSENELLFDLFVTVTTPDDTRQISGYTNVFVPHKVVVMASRSVASVIAAIRDPWFTEYVFPMVFAVTAISVSVWRWWFG